MFGHLVTPTNMNQMFVSCASLETIWGRKLLRVRRERDAHVQRVPGASSGRGATSRSRGTTHLNLHFESTGVLTHPDGSEDEREWFRCFPLCGTASSC